MIRGFAYLALLLAGVVGYCVSTWTGARLEEAFDILPKSHGAEISVKTQNYNHVSGVKRSNTPGLTALLRAFEIIESGGRLHVIGDGGAAYGLYQFHYARWLECGGTAKNWKRASRVEQDKIMRTALTRYLRSLPKGVDAITWVGTFHNNGHGRRTDTAYTIKLRAAYLNLK